MITINYKASVGDVVKSGRYAYIKSIDGGIHDGIRITVNGIDEGNVSLNGARMLIENHEVRPELSDLVEGVNRILINDGKGNIFRTERFLYENGFIKRAPMPDAMPSMVCEVLDLVDDALAKVHENIIALTKLLSKGFTILKYKEGQNEKKEN